MQLVTRKKLEIFVEEHALHRVEAMLNEFGVKGWSVFNGVEGAGAAGPWRQSHIESGGDMHMILAITSEESAAKALAWLGDYFSTYRGVVTISEVQVLRPERF
jgi:PII-like signaling protein